LQVGLSEVAVLLQKIGSFGDPRLFALTQAASTCRTASSRWSGAGVRDGRATGTVTARPRPARACSDTHQPARRGEIGVPTHDGNGHGMGSLQEFANTMTKEAMASMQQAALTDGRLARAVVTAPAVAWRKK